LATKAVAQQPFPPTSTPVEQTRISLLEDGTTISSTKAKGPFSNFRLFLKYDSEKPFQVSLGSHAIELPAGEAAFADATYEHIPGKPATIHIQRKGDLEPLRIEVPGSVISSKESSAESVILPGKDFPMEGPHTLMVRFQTTAKNGTLAARAPETGKWEPNGKTLFLRNGKLTYDIGWEGDVAGGPNLADGKEHIAVMTVDDDSIVELFVDGKSVARKELASKDDAKHVFKIGATATNFAGDFKDGSIRQVLFWKRNLDSDEVKSLGQGDAVAVNTPDFHWNPASDVTASAVKQEKPAPELISFGIEPGYAAEIAFADTNEVTFHAAWIQPLEKSDHAEIVAQWDDEAFARGKTIYAQLCVTCHGTATQEGSIPLSLKFHDPAAEFKNGSDPLPDVANPRQGLRPHDSDAAVFDPPEVRRHPLHSRGIPREAQS
jgi:mono/diheme cytochrome c family protein